MMEKELVREALRDAAEVADEVDEAYRVAAFQVAAERLLRRDGGAHPERAQARSLGTRVASDGQPESINELLALMHDRSHPDRFEAILLHSLRRTGVDGLTTDEVLKAYSEGRAPKPANASDVIAKCVKRGHVMEGEKRDGQKTWRLTVTGERYMEQIVQERMAE